MKLKDKIIIHNYSDLEDTKLVYYVLSVINNGQISETSKGKQYCFVTTFKDGITISSGRRNNTYTFYVERRN